MIYGATQVIQHHSISTNLLSVCKLFSEHYDSSSYGICSFYTDVWDYSWYHSLQVVFLSSILTQGTPLKFRKTEVAHHKLNRNVHLKVNLYEVHWHTLHLCTSILPAVNHSIICSLQAVHNEGVLVLLFCPTIKPAGVFLKLLIVLPFNTIKEHEAANMQNHLPHFQWTPTIAYQAGRRRALSNRTGAFKRSISMNNEITLEF